MKNIVNSGWNEWGVECRVSLSRKISQSDPSVNNFERKCDSNAFYSNNGEKKTLYECVQHKTILNDLPVGNGAHNRKSLRKNMKMS